MVALCGHYLLYGATGSESECFRMGSVDYTYVWDNLFYKEVLYYVSVLQVPVFTSIHSVSLTSLCSSVIIKSSC